MYVVVRQYEGASPLMDAMSERSMEVKELLTGVEGFVTYHAARDGDTMITVSICTDRDGAEETTQRAAAWVEENLPDVTVSPPRVVTGEVFLTF